MLRLAQQIEPLRPKLRRGHLIRFHIMTGIGKFSGNGVYLSSTVLLYADNLNIYLKCLFLCPGVL